MLERGEIKNPDLEIMGYPGGCYTENHTAEGGLENLRRPFDSALCGAELGKFRAKMPRDTEGSASLLVKTQSAVCTPAFTVTSWRWWRRVGIALWIGDLQISLACGSTP